MAASRSYSSSAFKSEGDSTSRSYKRARTVQDPDSSSVLLMIYTALGLTITAVDQNGALIPSYCIKARGPRCTGVTVIGSVLHIFGGSRDAQDSLDTYTLDLHNIPRALRSGRDLYEFCVRDPHKMIGYKVFPVVYYARERIYVLSGCIHDSDWPGIDCEYRPFPFRPAPWSRLDKPPLQKEWEGPPYITAHALVGDTSIVISLSNNGGAYVLSLESHTWTRLETIRLCFTGQPALLPSGIYISPSWSESTLDVFSDISSPPVGRLSIRETSRCVRHATTHQVATIGDVAFIIRCGSSKRADTCRAVYITIDTYEVSPAGDRVTKLLRPPKLLLVDRHPFVPQALLSCFPVLLQGL